MNATEFLWAIGRATAFTSAAVLAALALVALLRVSSPRLHRAAWFLAVWPSWLLVPWTWRVETPPAVSPADLPRAEIRAAVTVSPTAAIMPMPVAHSQATANPARPLVVVYAGGMIVLLGVGLARYLRFVKRLPKSDEALEPDWQHEWQRQLRALRIRLPLDLRVTPDLGPLLCFAPYRYLVLVPRPLWMALARGERTAILRHELAHWRRGDLWWSLAIRALALPQWFNPLAWLAIRRFDEAGEWACDDLVSRGRRSHELAFARSLLAAADFATTHTPGTAAIQGGQLARRVRRLVSQRFKEEAMMKKFLVLIPLVAIVVVQAIRIERVTAEEPAPISSQPAGTIEVAKKTVTVTSGSAPPAYVIEPPDVLLITPVRMAPKPPRRIRLFEPLSVQVIGIPANQRIPDSLQVDPDGRINLGPPYGRLKIADLTVDEAEAAIEEKLKEFFDDADVGVSLVWASDHQLVAGKYLVGPDGRINLRSYGTLYVSGMSIDEARRAIEERLAESLDNPKIALDVDQYNSKKYYVITRHPGRGDNVVAAPITGNDTVLDALALVDDALKQSSTKIWISRPTGRGTGDNRILPVNWDQIVDGTSTATNYQLLPGDRLFVVGTHKSGDLSHVAETKPTPQATTIPSPYVATETRVAPPTDLLPNRVEFNVDILEDRGHALSEYDALRGGAPTVEVDSDTIGPALRALESHGLIRKTASPKLNTSLGTPATMSLESEPLQGQQRPNIRLRLMANRSDRGEFMEIHLVSTQDGDEQTLNTAVQIVPGRTVLVPVPTQPAEQRADRESQVYLAITASFARKAAAVPAELPQHYYSKPQPAVSR